MSTTHIHVLLVIVKTEKRVLNVVILSFLPRCIECRGGQVKRKLSVRLSVKRVHRNKTEEISVLICTQ